jgi:hypothetical protein
MCSFVTIVVFIDVYILLLLSVDYDISPLEAVFYFILKLENGEIS